jgi:hypothetical protein
MESDEMEYLISVLFFAFIGFGLLWIFYNMASIFGLNFKLILFILAIVFFFCLFYMQASVHLSRPNLPGAYSCTVGVYTGFYFMTIFEDWPFSKLIATSDKLVLLTPLRRYEFDKVEVEDIRVVKLFARPSLLVTHTEDRYPKKMMVYVPSYMLQHNKEDVMANLGKMGYPVRKWAGLS